MKQAVEYSEDTKVFVLATRENRFACLAELSTGRRWAYAFTSQKKAKDFLCVMRGQVPEDADRLFPCTLKEWFDWQPQKKWPDLTIDPDAKQLRDYPLQVQADLSTHDFQCITRESANGKTYEVIIRPQRKPAARR